MRSLVLVLTVACADGGFPSDDPVPETAPTSEVARNFTVPLFGGGIAATKGWIAASDPDGDRIVVRSIEDNGTLLPWVEHLDTQSLQLAEGAGPSAMAWTGTFDPLLHVLLRGSGGLVVLQPGVDGAIEPTVVTDLAICASPRGLAWDEGRELMWVACASGELTGFYDNGEKAESFWLDNDLRDIVVLGDGRALVSRMRSAEVLVVDLDLGVVSTRWHPGDQVILGDDGPRTFVPRVLRRMVPFEDAALVLYQGEDTTTVDVDEGPEEQGAYAGGGGMPTCDGIVRTNITEVDADTGFGDPTFVDLPGNYVFDMLGQNDHLPTLATSAGIVTDMLFIDAPDHRACATQNFVYPTAGVTMGVAQNDGQVWAVTRDPFELGPITDVVGAKPRIRTGLGVFTDATGGIACVTCHPDGGDDGHTWTFSTGARRTQSLGGLAVSETAPFHWSGDMESFEHLFEDVGVTRMGLRPLVFTEQASVEEYLDALPAIPNGGPPRDPATVARGSVLFASSDVGCTECHTTWRYSNGESADVGTGGTFQVPSLIGVGGRLPLMHDGCAATLLDRFDPECGGTHHGDTSQLSSSDIDALVTFLETL